MSVYPPPERDTSIFNPADFLSTTTDAVTAAYVAANYLKIAGNQTVVGQETFQGGILTNAIGLRSGAQLQVTADEVLFSNNIQQVSGSALATFSNVSVTNSYKISGTDVLTSTTLGSSIVNSSLTSVGTLTSLSVTGTATAGNVNTTGAYRINNVDFLASRNTNSVAVGPSAGLTSQGANSIAVGAGTGSTGQGAGAVAIGWVAATTNQGSAAVAIGLRAGDVSQGANAVAVGLRAGETNQHANSIVLNASGSTFNSDGTSRFFVKPVRNNTTATSLLQYDATSGEITYGPTNIAGTLTTAAQTNITSLGTLSNVNTSGVYQVNGATFARLYGTNSVAIGPSAGGSATPSNSVAIGTNAGVSTTNSNCVILNATGTALNSDGTSRFFVKPIRNNTTSLSLLQYDATSGEITYGSTKQTSATITAANGTTITLASIIPSTPWTSLYIHFSRFSNSVTNSLNEITFTGPAGATYTYEGQTSGNSGNNSVDWNTQLGIPIGNARSTIGRQVTQGMNVYRISSTLYVIRYDGTFLQSDGSFYFVGIGRLIISGAEPTGMEVTSDTGGALTFTPAQVYTVYS